LIEKISLFIDSYNGEVDRWHRRGQDKTSVDDFVVYDDVKIKWSEGLKFNLQRATHVDFKGEKVRQSLYRPFCKQ
jgi:predicted helicase